MIGKEQEETEVNAESLLNCLVLFTKLYHKPFSAEALTAGIPIEKGKPLPELFSLNSSKSLFSRAAGNAGFKSSLKVGT